MDKLKKYIDYIFESAPRTREAHELKEEILSNLMEKYRDLLNEGKSEKEAYDIAVSGLGDINALIDSLEHPPVSEMFTKEEIMADKKRSAFITALAVGLYITCVIPVILFDALGFDTIGVVLMFVMVAAATVMLIYNSMTRLKEPKNDDSMVENFREWQFETSKKGQNIKAVNSAVTSLTLAVYIILSFTTGAWHITWVIFLIGSAVKGIVRAIFDMKG